MYSSFKPFHDRVRNRWTDLQTSTKHHVFVIPNSNAGTTAPFPRFYKCMRDGGTDRQTETDGWTDGWMDGQRDIHTDGYTDI